MTSAPGRTARTLTAVLARALWLCLLFFGPAVVSPACARERTSAPARVPVSDARLAAAIQRAIQRDAVLGAQPVQVSVLNGKVSLAGSVPTLADRWRASRVAGTFKGATSVDNGIVVNAIARSDEEIGSSVDDAIRANRVTRSTQVHASSLGGAVTIRGSAESPSQREELSEVAARVPGVRRVALAINLPPESRGDAQVSADVRNRLEHDARLDGAPVAVAVSRGTATLSGVVGSLFQHDAAVADASVSGVTNVNAGALRVDWFANEQVRAAEERTPPTDATIAEAVRTALLTDAEVGTVLPSVSVESSVVTLVGPVSDFPAAEAAVRDAYRVWGVRRVDARMALPEESVASDVEGAPGVVDVQDKGPGGGARPPLRSPQAIEDCVNENIFWDPRVGTGPVTVAVDRDGDVTLTGVVDTWGEVRAANADAVLAGAAHVTNRLRVAQASAASRSH